MESLRLHITIKREDDSDWWPDQYSVDELARFGLFFIRRDDLIAQKEKGTEETGP